MQNEATGPVIFIAEMNDLPESLFTNPVWHALRTRHRHFAICDGDACRYPADVTPFAAVAAPTTSALGQLRGLIAPAESVWLIGEHYPAVPGLSFESTLPCLQMVLPEQVAPPPPAPDIELLTEDDAPVMVELANLAFPGFFRARTHRMGSYYGVRAEGRLIAMGGERLSLNGCPEISGICTHPSHRGKGLAASLIWHLAREHRGTGRVSWLQVAVENRRAIELYERLGFRTIRQIMLHRIICTA